MAILKLIISINPGVYLSLVMTAIGFVILFVGAFLYYNGKESTGMTVAAVGAVTLGLGVSWFSYLIKLYSIQMVLKSVF